MKRGLSFEQRIAIVCGNADYADEIVCPTCDGTGAVYNTLLMENRQCIDCDGRGHIASPNLWKPRHSAEEDRR